MFRKADIFRPLVKRDSSPAAGHLFDRTCAELSAEPGCLVSSVKSGRSTTDTFFPIKRAPNLNGAQISPAPWKNANAPRPLGIYLIEHAPIYLPRQIAWFRRKNMDVLLLIQIFSIRRAPIYSAGQISSASWYNANVPQPLGIYLIGHAPIYQRRQIAWFLRETHTLPDS